MIQARATFPRLLRWLALLVVVGMLAMTGRQLAARIPEFAQYLESLGPLAALVFVVGYVVATIAFVPGSILTLAAGALFGLTTGVALVFVAATIGSTLAFLISRYLARGAVERRVADNTRFRAVDRAIAENGRRIVFLLRLSPVFPFALLNYALGLTQISLRDYMLASIGMLPGTILYVYYGKLAGDVATLAGGTTPPRDAGYYLVLALGLVATIVVTTLVTRMARAALRAATGPAAEL